MGTGGTIASILGAMLLGGMGKGMFSGNEESDETKKLPSDPQVLKFKQANVDTPEPIDAQAMLAKHSPGVKPTNANLNKITNDMQGSFDPRAARDGGDDYRYNGGLSNEALMGEAPAAPPPPPAQLSTKVPGATFSDSDTHSASMMRDDIPQIDSGKFGDGINPIKAILAKLMGTTPKDQEALDKRRGPNNRADIRKASGFQRPERGTM